MNKIYIILIFVFSCASAEKIRIRSLEWIHDSADYYQEKNKAEGKDSIVFIKVPDQNETDQQNENFDTSYAINLKTSDTTIIITKVDRLIHIQNDASLTAISTTFMAVITGISVIVSLVSIIVIANKK